MCAMNLLTVLTYSCLFLQIKAQYGGLQGTNYNIGDQSRQEVIDASGNIKGQYSYVDPTGKTVIVRYTAGQNGFQVENGPAAATASQPEQPRIIQPGVSYRGLQLSRSKYLGQLFRPAQQNIVPAYTQKQFEAYQDSLRDDSQDNNQLLDVTPAQFPNNSPQALGFNTASSSPIPDRTSFQQIRFLPSNNNDLNIPLFQSANNLNSRNSIQYTTDSPLLFRPNGNADLREIARNPIPPEYRVPTPARVATPITEESEESSLLSVNRDNRYFNFNF